MPARLRVALVAAASSTLLAAPAAAADRGSAFATPTPGSTSGGEIAPSPYAEPSPGPDVTSDQPPSAESGRPLTAVRGLRRRLVSVDGRSVTVRGRAGKRRAVVWLRVGKRGKLKVRRRVGAGRRFTITVRTQPGDAVWLRATLADDDGRRQHEPIGRARRWRPAAASWYGPGLYGNRTACGQRLTPSLRGVAHKSLPCGTELRIRYRGRTTRAEVVDRGPYVGDREFDLTKATAARIGFRATGRIRVVHEPR